MNNKYIVVLIIAVLSFGGIYAVEKPDGSIAIINYKEGSFDALDEVLRDLGFDGYPIRRVDPKEFPPREDRDYWIMLGGKIKVDQMAKQLDLNRQNQHVQKLQALRNKLGLTEEEWDLLNKKETAGNAKAI